MKKEITILADRENLNIFSAYAGALTMLRLTNFADFAAGARVCSLHCTKVHLDSASQFDRNLVGQAKTLARPSVKTSVWGPHDSRCCLQKTPHAFDCMEGGLMAYLAMISGGNLRLCIRCVRIW